MGSEIFAKEMRGDAERLAIAVAEGVREAAKGGSFPFCSVRVASLKPRLHRIPGPNRYGAEARQVGI